MQKRGIFIIIGVSILLALAVLLGFNYLNPNTTGVIQNVVDMGDEKIVVPVNPEVVNGEIEIGSAILLDVRTTEERQEDGYAASSTHLDFAEILFGTLPEVEKDMKIYVHCKGGVRAEEAKRTLQENGFTNVVNIGGLVDWERAGGHVIRE